MPASSEMSIACSEAIAAFTCATSPFVASIDVSRPAAVCSSAEISPLSSVSTASNSGIEACIPEIC